ncbi:DUF7288 family protein [Halobiforma nitratireducens]|nr:hypothetical protein [Halobiforma nitratireducens]
MIVLTAVLLAMQSVVLTPTAGGTADRAIQEGIQQETRDALLVASQDGNLSQMARYWDGGGGFEGTNQQLSDGEFEEAYGTEEFADRFLLGSILSNRFTERGSSYNVALQYEDEDGDRTHGYLVYQGSPASNAVTASYTVTLYEDQLVTSTNDETLEDADDAGNAAIPNVGDDDDDVYNVVEVRVIVW